ncbi:filamin-A isoform X1 [Rhinichthys klamathensis goyatoka]|uniref:filamin-A isoform X1 n=1 Tax=Rhinichthys klamathensis goyatoka TaxID=3034132 RepID=UPI0024B4FB48|nr:filamin-A isoform X1 [Rhinichthys klamathensis goyatoka]
MGDFKDSVTAAAINLADDAPWKKIQKNTFTRWCNEHLRSVELQISDLKFDLSDGLVLISLLEVLSHKRMFRKYHTRPTFRQLKLDNVSVALEFLDHEKVKLVSIDSKAIVDGNLKLILGLVWTLIQHYSISTLAWEDEANDSVSKLTPEIRLLGWIQNKVPELPITNFSLDWQDGKALGALVDGLAPGLCPDWESWDAVHRVSNTKEAMQQADDWLGVPQLIAPEEILDPAVDEQSVMTYLSLFPKARLKPGAPLKPKKVPKPKACRATGRGLQSKGMRVGQLAEFKVDTCKAGPGNLEVLIKDSSGKAVSVRQKDALEGVYTFEYTPTAKGDHTVDITWVGQHIAKSPFKVHVGSEAGPQKIRAWGPGLEGGTVGLSADFLVESVGVDSGMLGFAIEGPSQAKITCDDQNDGSWLVRFWPTEAGEYAVHLMCDDEEIQDSPFMASIRHKRKDSHPEKVKVEGPGVSQTGCVVNLQTQFTVDTRQAGEGELKVYAQRADGECVDVSVASEQSGVFVCSYIPSSLSKHTIAVSWGGVMVPGSPFIVTPRRIKITPCSPVWFKPDGSEMYYSDEEMDLDEDFPDNAGPGSHGELVMNVFSPSNNPGDATKVRACGPGLKEGVLGEQAEFIIDTSSAGSGRLAIRVEGPCEVTLKCLDNQDGTCTVFYLPTEHGMYKINVLFDNSHITGSPFQADIQKPIDPSKVLVTGPGLLQGKVGEPCIVNIDCAMAGSGDLSVHAVSDSGVIVQTEVKENEDGTFTAVYVPLTGGVYTLLLKYGGKVVPNFPAKVIVGPKVYKSHVKVSRQGGIVVGGREADTCQVVANGLGLRKGLTGRANMFSVNARSSVDDLGITVEGASECHVTCEDNGEGMYDVEYTPSVPGEYKITITSGEKSIPGSPFIASVEDVSADSGVCLQSGLCLSTNTVSQGTEMTGIKYSGYGIYTMSPTPSMEDGESLIDPQSPYKSSSPIQFQALTNCDCDVELPSAHAVNMEEIIVPGFKGRICSRTSQMFTIGCNSSGEAPETVAVVRPDGSMELLELKKRGDGTYSVAHLPTMDGCHLLTVKFTSEETFNRQFSFQVLPIDDTAQVNVACLGLTSGMCAWHPQTFTVDSTSTKKVPQLVAIMTPDGLTEVFEVRDNGDWTYTVNYTPSMEGLHSLMVKYTKDASFGSPFKFRVLPMPDSKYKHHGGQGLRNGTPVFGLDLDAQVCVNTPQTFTIDGSCTGEPPETVAVVTPDGKIMLLSAKDNGDGTYLVAYSPSVEGSHSIMVKYTNDDSFRSLHRFYSGRRDEDVLNKEEPSSQEGRVNTTAPQTSANCYSVAPETVTMVKANDVMGNRDRTCEMACAPNLKNSVVHKYTSEETFRSLSEFQTDLTVENTGPKICAQIPQSFKINCSKSGKPPECVLMITPIGKTELTEVKENPDGTYSVKYSPTIEGLHSLIVKYADDDSYCNPLRFHVLPHSASDDEHGINTEVCSKQLKEDVCAQIPQTFTACCNTDEAPETDMLKADGTRDLVEVLNNENRAYAATHTPSTEDSHSSAARNPSEEDFQRNYSPQSSSLHASSGHIGFQNQVEGRNVIPLGAINQAGFISCDIVLSSDISEGEITGEVITPSRKTAQPDVIDNKDGTIIIKFDPLEEGLHQLLIKSTGNDLPVLPLQFYANSRANRSTMAYGCGLMYGIANETATFTICQEDSASSELDITIQGPSEADVRCLDNADGTCTVSYLPTEPGDYEIQVQHNEMPIRGSPFKAKITDGNVRTSQVNLGSAVDFTISITEEDISQLSASIMSPTGNDVPCLLKTQPDSHLGVSFIPREAGEHLVSIMKDCEHVSNSPISLSISQAEIGDSSKVKAFGPGLHIGHTFCMSEFVVDTWDAGYGGLTVVIEGPSKVDVHTEEMEQGTCNISYHPIKAGAYKISVKFSDEDIPGSPFTAVVSDRGLMRENITYNQKASPIASIGSECSLAFKIPGTDTEALSAHVHEPSGTLGEAVIVATGSDAYAVSFLAKEMGVYNVTIKNQGQTIPGCPLQYTVGPLGQGGCEKIQVWGQGLQTALASVPADFNIWSREAGAGTLSVSVEGPGKIKLHFDDQLDDYYNVSYTAQVPGDYEVSVMFNEEHISESPFLVSVSAATDKSLTQGQKGYDHNQMCNSYEEPSLSEMEINISSDSSAEPVFLSNASKVICHGPGLSKGILGRKNTFYVDCSKAGRNLLFVGMHGPTVPCERVSIIHMGGHQYRINYAVKERGKYILAVKWGDEHIPGSPFHISVL